jgi:hypothetical protein
MSKASELLDQAESDLESAQEKFNQEIPNKMSGIYYCIDAWSRLAEALMCEGSQEPELVDRAHKLSRALLELQENF